jgi:hypothetical protein
VARVAGSAGGSPPELVPEPAIRDEYGTKNPVDSEVRSTGVPKSLTISLCEDGDLNPDGC